jgi:hypothetical protein
MGFVEDQQNGKKSSNLTPALMSVCINLGFDDIKHLAFSKYFKLKGNSNGRSCDKSNLWGLTVRTEFFVFFMVCTPKLKFRQLGKYWERTAVKETKTWNSTTKFIFELKNQEFGWRNHLE